MLTSHVSKYSNDVEEEAHCYVVQCRRICYFYIIDRLEQAKPRTAYKLKKYRERLANLLDQGKEHRREDQLQRERLEKSQKVMLSQFTMQQEEDPSQSNQWAKVSNIYKEFTPPPPSNPTISFLFHWPHPLYA